MIYYTDGAHSSKTNIGGWACVIPEAAYSYGYEENSTNNRMELTAVIAALKHFSRISDSSATIYTDSAYIANCFRDKWYVNWRKNGWRNAAKQPVKNRDLWEELLSLYEDAAPRLVSIEKVVGHSGDKYNEMCDSMAVKAREERIEEDFYDKDENKAW